MHTHPLFTNTGVDYFGPFEVKQGRSYVQRYGVMFTCLTSRAVHLEVAHSLNTDSFLAAIFRFVSRCGRPVSVYLDNGTNIASGDKELKDNLDQLNQIQIRSRMTQQHIEWHYMPPVI